MALVDLERSEAIYATMGPTIEASGGSAANTVAGVAALGGRAAFLGRVADDELGRTFTHDIRSIGVAFEPRPTPAVPGESGDRPLPGAGDRRRRAHDGHPPRRGLGLRLGRPARRPALLDPGGLPRGLPVGPATRPRRPCARPSELAHANDAAVALTLSDPFCVQQPPGRVPRAPERRPRHPVRQRGRGHAAVRDHGLRRGGGRRRGDRPAGRTDPGRGRVGGGHRRRARSRCPPHRSTRWSTPPAPATSSPPASSTGSPMASHRRRAPGSAPSAPPR